MSIKYNGAEIGSCIGNYQQTDFSQATVQPEFVVKGKKFYDDKGQLREGTLTAYGDISCKTIYVYETTQAELDELASAHDIMRGRLYYSTDTGIYAEGTSASSYRIYESAELYLSTLSNGTYMLRGVEE